IPTGNPLAVGDTADAFKLRFTGGTTSHHVMIDPVWAKQMFLLPGIHLCRELQVIVTFFPLNCFTPFVIYRIDVIMCNLVIAVLVNLMKPYQGTDHGTVAAR